MAPQCTLSKGGSSSQTTTVDPRTQQYVEQLRRAALNTQSNPLYGQARQAGQLGLSGLMGDPTAVSQLMNPYNSTLDPYWNQQRQIGLQNIGDMATQAGAYGGSRQGVAEGQFLADVANAQAGQRYGEFSGAMNRASMLANMGMGVDPQIMAMLQGSIGPYGQTQRQETQGDFWSQLLGAGMTLAPLLL